MWNDVPVHLFTRSKCALDPRHSENSANWKPVNCVFFLFCCCCFHRFVISNCFSSHIWLSGVTIISSWKQNSTNHTPTARRQRFTSLGISTAISCHTVCTNFEIKRNNQIAFFSLAQQFFLWIQFFFLVSLAFLTEFSSGFQLCSHLFRAKWKNRKKEKIIKSGWSHVATVRRFIQGQFTCAGCYGNEIDRSLAFNIHSDPFNWLYNQMFL